MRVLPQLISASWRCAACPTRANAPRWQSSRKRWTAKVHRSRTPQTGVAAGCANDSDRSASSRCRVRRHARRLRAAGTFRSGAAGRRRTWRWRQQRQHRDLASLLLCTNVAAPPISKPCFAHNDDDSGCERAPKPQRAAPQCVHASHILVSGAAPAAGGCGWVASPASSHAPPQTPAQGCGAS